MPFACVSCHKTTHWWGVACPHCRAPDALYAVEPVPAHDPGNRPAASPVEKLSEVSSAQTRYLTTGFSPLDHVLGGGLARGAVYLLAGEPGAGKSTLALTIADHVSARCGSLYVSGEEPTARLAERARRLGLGCAALDVCAITEMNHLARAVRRAHVRLVVVDSLNVLHSDKIRSRVGSPSQLLNSAIALVRLAKSQNCAILLIGHVTKSNQLTGPRSVEHYCDAMLHFNAVGKTNRRSLFASKNRFGPAFISLQFLMTETGLVPDHQKRSVDFPGIERVS